MWNKYNFLMTGLFVFCKVPNILFYHFVAKLRSKYSDFLEMVTDELTKGKGYLQKQELLCSQKLCVHVLGTLEN